MARAEHDFVDALLDAPAGVALVAHAEAEQREYVFPWDSPRDSDPAAVERAVEQVTTMSFGELLAWAVAAAELLAGPWSGSSQEELPWCYQLAPERRPIAVAISDRFEAALGGPSISMANSGGSPRSPTDTSPSLCSETSRRVYGNGEFTWEGLWTVTDPPPEVHDELISAWDYISGTTSRWRLPIRPDARVWTIDRPTDWVRLVETYPKVATSPHSGWELPGPSQHRRELKKLLWPRTSTLSVSRPGATSCRTGRPLLVTSTASI